MGAGRFVPEDRIIEGMGVLHALPGDEPGTPDQLPIVPDKGEVLVCGPYAPFVGGGPVGLVLDGDGGKGDAAFLQKALYFVH